jgi:hypothetical protein
MQTPGNPLIYFFLNMNSKGKSSYATSADNLTSITRSNHLGDSSSTIVKISTLLLNFRGIIVFFPNMHTNMANVFFFHIERCSVLFLFPCPAVPISNHCHTSGRMNWEESKLHFSNLQSNARSTFEQSITSITFKQLNNIFHSGISPCSKLWPHRWIVPSTLLLYTPTPIISSKEWNKLK